jgi:hypothetical protein
MKTRTNLLSLVLFIAVLIVVGNIASGQDAYVVKEDEELFGTWVNPEYDGRGKYARIVMEYINTWDEYLLTSSEAPVLYGEFTINEKWKDTDGNTFYKIIVTASGPPYYVFLRIDEAGKVYEDVWSTSDMPTHIDPKDERYRIYYR